MFCAAVVDATIVVAAFAATVIWFPIGVVVANAVVAFPSVTIVSATESELKLREAKSSVDEAAGAWNAQMVVVACVGVADPAHSRTPPKERKRLGKL